MKGLKKEKTRKFKQSFVRLRRFLNEWDPLGITNAPSQQPVIDEYDCLVTSLLSLLYRKAGRAEIVSHLTRELSEHFGVNPAVQNPDEFVERIMTCYDNELIDVSEMHIEATE